MTVGGANIGERIAGRLKIKPQVENTKPIADCVASIPWRCVRG